MKMYTMGLVNSHPFPASAPRPRILVVKLRALGDTILLTSSLKALIGLYPQAEIDVVVPMASRSLLEGFPGLTHVWGVEKPKGIWNRLLFWWQLVWLVGFGRYHLSFALHASMTSALLARWAVGLRKGCVVHHHELITAGSLSSLFCNWLSDFSIPHRGELKANTERDLDALRAVGVGQVDAGSVEPQLFLRKEEMALGLKRLQGAFADLKPTDPVIFLGVGASKRTKRWQPEAFGELMERFPNSYRFLVCTESPRTAYEREWSDRLKDILVSHKDRVAYFSDLPLRDVLGLLAHGRVYVGSDSGLKHAAAALGLKTVTLFGPESPLEWHPYDRTKHPLLFDESLACRTINGKHWCTLDVCLTEENRCMSRWTADDVYGLVQKVLS